MLQTLVSGKYEAKIGTYSEEKEKENDNMGQKTKTFEIQALASDRNKNWGDLGNGLYRNPILNADYSDPDVIRVKNAYYMISSTINLCPGMVILKSFDLVNWETISYAITADDLRKLAPEMNWDRMNRYGTGVYAGAIRYLEWREPDESGRLIDRHRWFVHATLFLDGITVSYADNPEGPWTTEFVKDKNGKPLNISGWDDPCAYWDLNEDKTIKAAYMSASKPGPQWYIRVFKLSCDGTQLLDGDVEFMKISGDTTRKRTGNTPDITGLKGTGSGDPLGLVINSDTGEGIISSQGMPSLNNHEFLSIKNAIHYPGREGTVIRDVQTAEASKIIRFGKDTHIGNTTFCGRHGENQLIADYIYIFNNEDWGHDSRFPVISRAKCIYGDVFDQEGNYLCPGTPENPGSFETQRLLLNVTDPYDTLRPNQGAFIDLPSSMSTDKKEHWYFITQLGNEEVLAQGRPSNLMPVKWIDGWPVPGNLDSSNKYKCEGISDVNASIYDGTGLEGNTVTYRHHPDSYLKPGILNEFGSVPINNIQDKKKYFQGSDKFLDSLHVIGINSTAEKLSQIWQWNHIPRKNFWSLNQRSGHLRMYAYNTLDYTDNFFKVGNTICQRYVGSGNVEIEVEIDISNMANGQICGLSHFNGGNSYAAIGVEQNNDGVKKIIYSTGYNMKNDESKSMDKMQGDIINNSVQKILFRSWVGPDRINLYSYSVNGGSTFIQLGEGYKLVPAGYRGDLIGIFTYNNTFGIVPMDIIPNAKDYINGFIDVGYFRYEFL